MSLESVYQDNFTSFARFYKALREEGVKVTKKKAKEFYDSQDATQLFRPVPKANNTIFCPYGIGCLQADLLDVSRFASRNKNIRFYLSVVDVQSRYAWMRELKSKEAPEVLTKLRPIITAVKRKASTLTLTTDLGSEFMGVVATYLDKNNIDHYASDNKTNTAIVERFHRTAWNYIKKKQAISGSIAFADSIPTFLKQYNSSPHGSLMGYSPADLYNHGVLIGHIQPPERGEVKFNIGDFVRKTEELGRFAKKSLAEKFSRDVYKIVDKDGQRFVLESVDTNNRLKKTYLPRQLLRTTHKKSSSLQAELDALNQKNKTERRNKREPAFKGKLPPPRRSKREVRAPDRLIDA